MHRILITGSAGLIGHALAGRLATVGYEVAELDIANAGGQDVTDYPTVAAAMAGCAGVIHLAAVSRVLWGERDPARCHAVNVQGTRNVLTAARRRPAPRPWVLAASSREVYGQAASLPVVESAPFGPLNVYARSKAAVEDLVDQSGRLGLRASVIRFSSVYGTTADHRDRVAPAFARMAAAGGTLRVDGTATTLDFTHVDDVAAALTWPPTLCPAAPGYRPCTWSPDAR